MSDSNGTDLEGTKTGRKKGDRRKLMFGLFQTTGGCYSVTLAVELDFPGNLSIIGKIIGLMTVDMMKSDRSRKPAQDSKNLKFKVSLGV